MKTALRPMEMVGGDELEPEEQTVTCRVHLASPFLRLVVVPWWIFEHPKLHTEMPIWHSTPKHSVPRPLQSSDTVQTVQKELDK